MSQHFKTKLGKSPPPTIILRKSSKKEVFQILIPQGSFCSGHFALNSQNVEINQTVIARMVLRSILWKIVTLFPHWIQNIVEIKFKIFTILPDVKFYYIMKATKFYKIFLIKVKTFWAGHKIWKKNLPLVLTFKVKRSGRILWSFQKKMNFSNVKKVKDFFSNLCGLLRTYEL